MRGEDSFEQSDSSGKAVAWALRQVVGWSVVAGVLYVLISHSSSLMPARPAATARVAAPAADGTPVTNTLRYPADGSGHVRLDADVDGGTVHFVVDTGSTVVALTRADAEAAGLNPAGLVYSVPVNTANGETRAAPVTLRSVRLGQLTIEDVQAVVEPSLPVSLLGMSFLSRLDRWEMRGGVLTISY